MRNRYRRGPLIAAGVLMGAGLGGFADGILFHQILQLHNMLSGRIPVTDLVSAKINMAWDGFFHASVWLMTCIGLGMLFRAGGRADVPWSGRMFLGSLSMGWGLFNLIEGVIDHLVLGIHHVVEYAPNHLPADIAFLAFGAILLTGGWLLVRAGGFRLEPGGEAPGGETRLAV
ncbi:MAG: hypothetical protein JWP91_1379 [Fibrobacteres bacterium]|nr:hypothetical protein [Fibrobacterota bacterium]